MGERATELQTLYRTIADLEDRVRDLETSLFERWLAEGAYRGTLAWQRVVRRVSRRRV